MFSLRIASLAVLLAYVTTGINCQNSTIPVESFSITSPIGSLRASLSLTGNGRLFYQLFHLGDQILGDSDLGLIRLDSDFTSNLTLIGCDPPAKETQQYDMLHGKRHQINVVYMRSSCAFENANSSYMHVELAVSETSFAFRYYFPPDGYVGSRYVLGENTSFNIITSSPGESYQILQPYDAPVPKYQTFYQPRESRSRVPIGVANSSSGFALPGLFKTSVNATPFFLHIKEAGFDGRYPASHFTNSTTGHNFRLDMPDPADGNGMMGAAYAHSTLPWALPWRIVTVGRDSPAAIIEDTSVTDLSAPSQLQDIDFVRPGVASWSWWSKGNNSQNYTAAREFIDLASRQGWAYSILDARWDKQTESGLDFGPWVPLSTVQEYARSRNVKTWLWANSAGENNNASILTKSPKDLLWQPDIRQETLARMGSVYNVSGLKVDGIQSDKQAMMSYLLDILRDAAAARLMVVFHNCPTPKGWERTWPNLLSSEALVASEFYANAAVDYGSQMPENNVNQAFARYPIGPADYSPGTFSRHLYQNDKMITTDAHETALNVIIDSGIRILPDTPEMYGSKPAITRLLGEIPFVWDQTTFLAGEPGRYFCVARKAGDILYIAAINGETTFISPTTNISDPAWKPAVGVARDLIVDITTFIQQNETTVPTMIISDTIGSQDGIVLEGDVAAAVINGTKVTIHMEPFGGFVMQIKI